MVSSPISATLEMAGPVLAVSTLAFFGNGRLDFRRIGFVEFLDHECVCDGLFERAQGSPH